MADETERGFLDALARDANDAETRGVYADWLEEHGRLDDALLVRAGPVVHAYRAIVREKLLRSLGVVARRHGRWAQGCVGEIAGWPLVEPDKLLQDAQRFVKSRGWDPADGAPLTERADLVMAIAAVGRRRLFDDPGSPHQRELVALHASTELVLESWVAVDDAPPRPSGGIEGVVTVHLGMLHWLGSGGPVAVRIDTTDAWAVGELASRALARPYAFDGAPDTARGRRITEARLTHFGILGEGPRAGRLVLTEFPAETSTIDDAWRDLVELLAAILVPRAKLGERWRELVERCRRAT